jgi:large subunit ribosomal protein L17
MRHLKKGKKLSRETGQRKALLKSLINALVAKGRIRTTLAKAKAAAPKAEKLIHRAKSDSVVNRRIAAAIIGPALISRLFKEIGPKYKERKGGYTRIIKVGARKSDGASMAILELIDEK